MSRLGKMPIIIPDKVKVEIKGNEVNIQGPLGKETHTIHHLMNVKIEENKIIVTPKGNTTQHNMLHGLSRTLLNNIVNGVISGYSKALEIHGVGYKASVEGRNLVLNLGFSSPKIYPIPEGIKIDVDKLINVKVFGINKALVGETAARIRAFRPPEPYKGKGVRYVGEHIIRKAGKTAASGAGAK